MFDYLPNIHPILVHFPIALLTLGVGIDAVALLWRKEARIKQMATALVVIGAVLLIPTYLTGRQAGDQATSPFAQAQLVLTEHADWAWLTLWFFLIYAAARLGISYTRKLEGTVHAVAFLIGAGGLFLVMQTGDHGGQLVFEMGVGVQPVAEAPEGAFDPKPEIDPASVGPNFDESGSVRWRFQPGAEVILPEYLLPLTTAPVSATVESRQAALVLTPDSGDPQLFVLETDFEHVQVDLSVNLAEFLGTFGLVHHLRDQDNFDFLLLEDGKILLGRVVDGERQVMHEAPLERNSDWHRYGVVGTGEHFRGYVNGELILHGHDGEIPPGKVGFLIQGTGVVKIDDLHAQRIEE
jgi:uncharacterized membrane protein